MSYSVHVLSNMDIKDNYSLDSLKYNYDLMERTIKELREKQQLIMNHASEVAAMNSKVVITVSRSDYRPPVSYEVEVNRLFPDIQKKVWICNKKFSGSREDKAALKEYVKTLEVKYNVTCNIDYKKLKL